MNAHQRRLLRRKWERMNQYDAAWRAAWTLEDRDTFARDGFRHLRSGERVVHWRFTYTFCMVAP